LKILCVFGRHNYGDAARGTSYEYANFIPALRSLGHEVVFFDSWDKGAYRNFSDMNRQLLQTVEREGPDVVFCVLITYEVWLETLQLIREGSHAALLHWATDDSWKYEQFSRFMGPAFDLYASTYRSALSKAAADGYQNFVLTQWAADSSRMAEPLPSAECRYDLSFIGSTYGNRKQWINDLAARGLQVETFGYGWPNGPVAASEIAGIMRASRISLNFGDSGIVIEDGRAVRSRQIKARVFEVPGAGGLLLTEPAEHLKDYFEPGREIVVFDGLADLVRKIHRLLAHPEERDAIARAGFERTQREHNYEMRLQPLLVEAVARRRARSPGLHGIDFIRFESLAAEHRLSVWLWLLKWMLLLPCLFIWGRARGQRAARRMLYEFSWRYLGRHAYTVRNWAGRLFYRES